MIRIIKKKFDENLKKRFLNIYNFSNRNINEFIYPDPYEYMDEWEKFNETSLPEREDFWSHLNLDNTTAADYAHGKKVWKDLEIKHFGEYYDLYVQSDTLLSADAFESFWNMCLEIHKLVVDFLLHHD